MRRLILRKSSLDEPIDVRLDRFVTLLGSLIFSIFQLKFSVKLVLQN